MEVGKIDFSMLRLGQIGTKGYALYKATKTIYIGKEFIKLNEISDTSLISRAVFKAIVHAIMIASEEVELYLNCKNEGGMKIEPR